jgi:mannose/fructose-specific phosphotransferase system component IIA
MTEIGGWKISLCFSAISSTIRTEKMVKESGLPRNFGVVLVSHGAFAEGLLDGLEMLMGPQAGVETVSLEYGMGQEEMLGEIERCLNRLKGYPRVLIVADLAGGTPANVSSGLAARNPACQLVSGTNLAFLCEVMTVRDLDVQTLDECIRAGREGLVNTGSILRDRLNGAAPAGSEEDDL